MFGLDEQLASLGSGGGTFVLVLVAVLLGLRHATDPDHLAAVTALIASDEQHGSRRAGRLGLAWGGGHATTLTLLGIPIVLLDAYLPEPVQVGSEVLVGLVIMGLALRLVLRWRREGFHAHAHEHGGARHEHLHVHPDRSADHGHDHGRGDARGAVRSLRGSYAIGLVHGIGGSAGVGLLLLAAIPDDGTGLLALVVFAAFTAVSMCVASTLFGQALAGQRVRTRLRRLTPAMGAANFAFGAWYALGALGVLPYVL